MVATTAAAPAMSDFISHMPCAGLIDTPPVSKVMPLPTSATGPGECRTGCSRTGPAGAGPPNPDPTARIPPNPPSRSASSSSTSTARPASCATSATCVRELRRAQVIGRGVDRSRARRTARVTTAARSSSAVAAGSAASGTWIETSSTTGHGLGVLL